MEGATRWKHEMNQKPMLEDRRSAIIKKWQDVIIRSYPKDSQGFLRREKSQFANPVGSIIGKEIETLYDAIVTGDDPDRIASCLDTIIRIRAVQDFTPSKAVAFVHELKQILREELETGNLQDLRALESRVDEVLLLAFDVYSKCRQKIYEIRIREVKNQVGRLLERANLIVEVPEQAPVLRDDNAGEFFEMR